MSRISRNLTQLSLAVALSTAFSSCVPHSSSRKANMGMLESSPQARQLQISSEPTGDFFYARRYFVEKTRFWGYVRQPRQPWSKAQLVVMNEGSIHQPDRLPEDGPWNARHGFDQNYEYRITGDYTGKKIYDPASNLFLPEFKATGYTRLKTKSGWLFSPVDHYDSTRITLINESVAQPKR